MQNAGTRRIPRERCVVTEVYVRHLHRKLDATIPIRKYESIEFYVSEVIVPSAYNAARCNAVDPIRHWVS